ncbi:serine protease family s1c htra-related [Holotrichia oblita]|nr:serine protease family s1c htra-related [Holotrichia oblita]
MEENYNINITEKENEISKALATHKKKHSSLKKFAAVLCVTAVGFTGLGLGVGMGKSVDRLMNVDFGTSTVYAEVKSDTVAEAVTDNSSTRNLRLLSSGVSAQGYSVTEIFKSVSDSIVSINCTTQVQFRNRLVSTPSAGSGIIFAEDDEKIYIVTNNHVIEGKSMVTISLDDENEAEANYVGSDYQADLAIISVTKEELEKAGITNYEIAYFGDSNALEIGEPAIAIGNALGEGKSATLGIISAKNKTVTVDNKALNVIQTDAAINPGNSGGALVNSKGEVIGINTVKIKETGVEGMGYCIPSNTVIAFTDDIMTNGMIEKPYMGISGQTIDETMRDENDFPSTGVYVWTVYSGSGADDGGLREGDLIYAYNDIEITSMEDLTEALANTKTGETVTLSIYRSNYRTGVRSMEIEVEIRNQNATANF